MGCLRLGAERQYTSWPGELGFRLVPQVTPTTATKRNDQHTQYWVVIECWWSAPSGGGLNLLYPLLELNPLNGLRHPVRSRDPLPFPLGRYHHPMDHDQSGLPAQAAPGLPGAVPDRREGALERIGGADLLPVFGPKGMEGHELIPVLDLLADGIPVFDAVGLYAEIKRRLGVLPCPRHPDVLRIGSGPVIRQLRHRAGDVGRVLDPATPHPCIRMDIQQCGPEVEAPVTDGHLRWGLPACLQPGRQLPGFSRSPSMITGMSFPPCSSGPMTNSVHCRSPLGLGLKRMPSARGWTCRPAVKSLLLQASGSSRQETMNPGVKRRRRLACIREGLADGQTADDNGRRRTQASVPDQGKGALRRRRRSEFAGTAAKCRRNYRQVCKKILQC